MTLQGRLVLASQSPRRREILGGLGLRFEVRPADIDETPLGGEEPRVYARRMALEKAREVAGGTTPTSTSTSTSTEATVLGADTIVVCDGVLMGKPRDDAQARTMLSRLAGAWHEVTTAVCALGPGGEALQREVVTQVRFRELTGESLRRYVATGEGRDKAGSYGIQGLGSGLVAELRGSYSNVVGLPAAETLELLESAGCVREWP